MSDPTNQYAINTIAFYTGKQVKPVLLDEAQIDPFFELYQKEYQLNQILQQNLILKQNLQDQQNLFSNVNDHADKSLIQFVDNIILHAIKQSASDIHIEPYESCYRVRYRQHGLLFFVTQFANQLAMRLIARLKVLAKLDISDRRFPQDGQFKFKDINIRLNTCPTCDGEKIVLRLLSTSQSVLTIDELGMNALQKVFL